MPPSNILYLFHSKINSVFYRQNSSYMVKQYKKIFIVAFVSHKYLQKIRK